MSESFTARTPQSAEKGCKPMSASAIDCTSEKHACAARGIWPRKTAECWAAAAGVKPRMAKYWLAGRPVSDAGRLALVRELA